MVQTLERRGKYIAVFLSDEHTPDVTNILVTGDNVLHRKRVCLQKSNEGSILKCNVQMFRNSPYSHSHLPPNPQRLSTRSIFSTNFSFNKTKNAHYFVKF